VCHVKRLALASAIVLGSSLLSFTPSSALGSLAPYLDQNLQWSTCSFGQCASLKVPLDYTNLDLGDISIAVSRTVHTGPNFQGSIVVNPGGPGSPGLEFASYVAKEIAPTVAKDFDFIGFDPRGVGKSAAVTCMTSKQTAQWLSMDSTPDTPAETAALMKSAGKISQGCLKYSPRMASKVGTPFATQDLDLLRSALHEDKLNWLGFSYGTTLGASYIQAFPNRVGRFVLDGAVDPALNGMQLSFGQSQGFQKAFQNYAQKCLQQGPCPLGSTRTAITARVNSLLARLDTRPLRTKDGTPLTQSLGTSAIFTAMYSTDMWELLTSALTSAYQGDGTGLLELSWMGSDQTGPATFGSNMQSAYYAIDCWDLPATPAAASLASAAQKWAKNAPIPEMAKSMSWSNAPCSRWFAHDTNPPTAATSSTAAPILIIGTRFDPATPYAWARALNAQLATSTLLTYGGNGHTAFGGGSTCIDSSVNSYLLTGLMPQPGKSCPA